MRIRDGLLCGVALCLSAALDGSASAQTSGTSTGSTASAAQEVETITVTARRREESIQNAPVAVTAVGAAQLDRMFVKDLTDLNRAAPNFQIEGVGAIHRNAAVIFSRGIGYGNVDQGRDPAVGISVDGVFYSRNIGALEDMWDIQNVQILRGPQGTLFGRNTIGGVVNITTQKPDFDSYEAKAMARVGNLGINDYGLVLNAPLTDDLAIRLSAESQYSSGAFTNEDNSFLILGKGPLAGFQGPSPRGDRHLGGEDVQTFRGSVRWQPITNLTFDFSLSYIHDRSESVGGQNGSFPGEGPQKAGDLPRLPPDLLYLLGEPGFGYPGGPTDPYHIQRDFPSGDYQDTTMAILNGRYNAGPFDIVSVTGYMKDWNYSYNDYDNTALPFLETGYGLHHDQFSQEVRLESNDQSPLQWVGGLYYFTQTWDAEQHFFLPILVPPAPFQEDFSKQTDHDYAAFVQADYHILPNWEITGGIRYTREDKNLYRLLQYVRGTPKPPPILDASGQIPNHTWSDFTYHLGTDYHFDEDTMAYASFSTGFVGGGYNSRSNLAATIGPFRPEKAKSYEVGFKSDYMDHRLRLDLAAFWTNYSDVQVGVFQPFGVDGEQQVVANDAFERARGVELEATAIPVPNMLLSASIGYLNAVYTSFRSDVTGLNPAAFACGGLVQHADKNSGCYLIPAYSPDWTMKLEASYDFDLNGMGKLTPDASYNYETSHFTDITNNPVGFQKAYGVFNASLNYTDPTGRWTFSVWGKNLADQRYILSAVPTADLFTQLYFADPRTFGVQLTFDYDKPRG